MRIGLGSSQPFDTRKIAVDLADVVIQWEIQARRECGLMAPVKEEGGTQLPGVKAELAQVKLEDSEKRKAEEDANADPVKRMKTEGTAGVKMEAEPHTPKVWGGGAVGRGLRMRLSTAVGRCIRARGGGLAVCSCPHIGSEFLFPARALGLVPIGCPHVGLPPPSAASYGPVLLHRALNAVVS